MKLEEEQVKLVEICTAWKMPSVDLNECMALESAKGLHRCSESDNKFESSYLLANHIQNIHEKKKEHKCDECNVEFHFGWKL